ncbi:MAG: hypothetical protein KDE32_02090 [Novosphingobium sp.]|nr:hypothetical protein [Novosphingobium sp.]
MEKSELAQVSCRGSDGRPLTVVTFQFSETVATPNGPRRRPGAFRLELATGEEVRRIDRDCFEVIATGELVMTAPDPGPAASITEEAADIPLCHQEELVRQENRLREAERAGKASSGVSGQAASSSSAGPKNS